MATAFTSTSSALIFDNMNGGATFAIRNAGAGILDIDIESNPDAADPTVSDTNSFVSLGSGDYYETPPGTRGKIFGKFRTSGTAYWRALQR